MVKPRADPNALTLPWTPMAAAHHCTPDPASQLRRTTRTTTRSSCFFQKEPSLAKTHHLSPTALAPGCPMPGGSTLCQSPVSLLVLPCCSQGPSQITLHSNLFEQAGLLDATGEGGRWERVEELHGKHLPIAQKCRQAAWVL